MLSSMELAHWSYVTRQTGLAISLVTLARTVRRALVGGKVRMPERDVRMLQQRFRGLLETDWNNAEAGIYPRELLFDRAPLKELAKALPELLTELPRVLQRSRQGRFDALPDGIDRGRYPSYYLRTFHWQSDGWLSLRSARLYD